jgi:hypothetical protein
MYIHSCRLVESDGVDAMVEVMDAFTDNARVQKQGCWAVLTLAGEDKIADELMRKGVPAALANALYQHR